MCSREYTSLSTAEIREKFLDFFASKGCKRYPSSSLIPDDPSLLLSNAGMNQFKQYYLGTKTMPEIGACSCQKCLRTNDIENIGDARHLSFFEMLGNFSFGGYDKRQACAWAYEFITSPKYLGLPVERLYFTVFTEDNEGAQIWQELGIDPSHISRLGEDDNFWAAGPTGPCGPCSEIYFDQGEACGCGSPTCAPGCDCDRYLEFWNLVFTQYDRLESGELVDLPHQNIDTGMGLERIAAIMQYKHTNYEGDILSSLIHVGEKLSCKTYGTNEKTDISLRILADHSRSVTFMIGDGILPSNEGRGYVLRRLLRRAVFHGKLLGIEGCFIGTYAQEVMRLMGDIYPELIQNKALIEGIIKAEEEHFSQTLENGQAYLLEEIENLGDTTVLAGEIAFKLHDTYGFPIDLTQEIAQNHNIEVDLETYKTCMEQQRAKARSGLKDSAWSQAKNVWVELSDKLPESAFVGYETEEVAKAHVLAIVQEGVVCDVLQANTRAEVVFDCTPCYAEMGGEVADYAHLIGSECAGEISDVQLKEGVLIVHTVALLKGSLSVGDTVSITVDHKRRELIRRNHTATHLLDAALKQVLGAHVAQAGSLVEPNRLRFDFTHFEGLSSEVIEQIERKVNDEIFAAKPVIAQIMPIEEARKSGAVALFGEKYGEEVRVVSVGCEDTPFSREFCGGLHARNSAEIGLFKIVSESSVGSNVRRIEALTSLTALEYLNGSNQVLNEVAVYLKTKPDQVLGRVEGLNHKVKETEQKLKKALSSDNASQVKNLVQNAYDCNGYKLVVTKLEGVSAPELRSTWDSIRDTLGDACACVLLSSADDAKATLLAAGTDKAVALGFHAGKVISAVAPFVGGKGGGKPNMAQGGGSDPAGIDRAINEARTMFDL